MKRIFKSCLRQGRGTGDLLAVDGQPALVEVGGHLGAVGKAGRLEKIWPMMWCGTLLCGVLFYAVANTYSWLAWPGYQMSAAGWWQAQTTGLPGINPPAWMFLRNALIADSIWCAIAGLLCFAQHRSRVTGSAVAPAR